MADCTLVSAEERKRRETFLRGNQRPYVWYDVFTYTYPIRSMLSGMGIFALTVGVHSVMYKRPWYYAIRYKAAGLAGFATLFYYTGKLREHNYGTRDAVVDHYMELHPEDFERVTDYYGRQYSGLLLPWIPIRAEHRNYGVSAPETKKTVHQEL